MQIESAASSPLVLVRVLRMRPILRVPFATLRGRPMKTRLITTSLWIATACLLLVRSAHAGVTAPGSLLVYPRWDNTPGTLTLLTVTNTNTDQASGAVDVEFDYIDGATCQEFNRSRTLTPGDELTVATAIDNPNALRGYAFVFAKSHATGKAIKFDWLIGSSILITSQAGCAYEIEPFVFKAAASLAEGAVTDLNSNNLRDFDGSEYEPLPDVLLFPSFAAVSSTFTDDLLLINLTGGGQFTAVVDLLVYNDNEEVFSAQFSFTCWIQARLSDISPIFTDAFLKTTNHSPTEIAGAPNAPEFGWFSVDGHVSMSTAVQFQDPAILAVRSIMLKNGVLVPAGPLVASRSFCAILPFARGTQTNGSLLSQNLFGN
jgi:hypothetical protein